jgi:hydroxyacylglutathione hydrolase
MNEIADDLYDLGVAELAGLPPSGLNVFLMGGVIVDAGVRQFADLILGELTGKQVTGHAITHGHMDHQGASAAICAALSIPFFCPEREADAVESGEIQPLVPASEENRHGIEQYAGPGVVVARRLREGDEVGGFVVVDSPGHSPGHISFWRESDRVLVVGDTISNMDADTFEIGLHEPKVAFTLDPVRNRESIRKLAALEPQVLCFGHGPAVTAGELHAFVERLPS